MVIGDNVIIHANAVIGSDGFGFAPLEDKSWKKIEHTGNVIVEDDVEIGANVCVDKSQMGSTGDTPRYEDRQPLPDSS